jgi:hypothetical protein
MSIALHSASRAPWAAQRLRRKTKTGERQLTKADRSRPQRCYRVMMRRRDV